MMESIPFLIAGLRVFKSAGGAVHLGLPFHTMQYFGVKKGEQIESIMTTWPGLEGTSHKKSVRALHSS